MCPSSNDKFCIECKYAEFKKEFSIYICKNPVHGRNLVTKEWINPNKSFDQQHEENCSNLIESAKDSIKEATKIIVLDDGGTLLSIVKNFNIDKPIVGTEQTSSGFRKLENSELNFPVYNVARSRIKLELETPYIVELGIARTKEKIQMHGISAPKILVVGLGPIGKEMVRALNSEGFSVVEYDKIHGEQNLMKLIQQGINVVIGTTGSQILSHDELLELNNLASEKILMVSMSSSDREFELWKMRDLFREDRGIHDDVLFENIVIANNGFPITFRGQRIESLPEEMDRTMGLLFAGVVLGALNNSNEKGLIDISEDILTMLE
jgi:hypothetical protein